MMRSHLYSGANIYVQGIAATPTVLLQALCDHANAADLKNINLYHMHLEGPAPWVDDKYGGSLYFYNVIYNIICTYVPY